MFKGSIHDNVAAETIRKKYNLRSLNLLLGKTVEEKKSFKSLRVKSAY